MGMKAGDCPLNEGRPHKFNRREITLFNIWACGAV